MKLMHQYWNAKYSINATIGHENLKLMPRLAPIGLTYNSALTQCYLGLTGQKDHSTGKEHHHRGQSAGVREMNNWCYNDYNVDAQARSLEIGKTTISQELPNGILNHSVIIS